MKKIFAITGTINYLIVVFLNAFTDLGHKIIIQNTIFKVYDGSTQIFLTAIVNSLILLPFILVFSPSGFLADRFNKNAIMKYAAVVAVFITLGITYSYYQGWFYMAFAMTFLLALQSAVYSPAKYGYIKELVGDKNLTAGNGAVQAVTTSAILLGIIFYTYFFETILHDNFTTKEDILKIIAPIGWFLVAGSIIEMFLAFRLPDTNTTKTTNKFSLKEYSKGYYLSKNIKIMRENKEIFSIIIALGLFWSISQVILAIFGEYAKSDLGISNTIIVQGIMALSVVGIIVGSISATTFAKYYINTGISAISALGITIIVSLIPFTHSTISLALEFIFFGFFSGLLMVPLNARIQHLAEPSHMGTILAGNNFIQTIFMFLFLMLTTAFAYLGADAKILFYLMILVGIYLAYKLLDMYLVMAFWSFIEAVLKFSYEYKYEGLENIPKDKAVLLMGNHVSWLDWFIIQLPIERRINYMIDKDVYNYKIVKPFMKKGELIPISPRASKDAFAEASRRLKDGKIVGIFPEGEISNDDQLSKFHRGFEYIELGDAVIVPYFIDGIFGSIFARYKGNDKKSIFKKRVIKVYFGEAIQKPIKAEELQNIIKKMKNKRT